MKFDQKYRLQPFTKIQLNLELFWVLVNIFFLFYCSSSMDADFEIRFPGAAKELLLYLAWINFLFVPGYAIHRLFNQKGFLFLEGTIISLAYTLAIYLPFFIVGYIFQLPVSVVARTICLLNILLLTVVLFLKRKQRTASAPVPSGEMVFIFGLLILVAVIMRYFKGSLESDAIGYIGIINRYVFLDKALLNFPWDQGGGILPSHLFVVLFLLCAAISKVTAIHPLIMWLLSPVILAPVSLLVIIALIKKITGNHKIAVFTGCSLIVLSMASGLSYIGWNVWTNWWNSILFPRQFVYHIIAPVLFYLFFHFLKENNEGEKRTFILLLSLCASSIFTNLPAGVAVVGQVILLSSLSPFIVGKDKLPYPWWLTCLLIGLTLMPAVLLNIYAGLHTPAEFVSRYYGSENHETFMKSWVGTFSHQLDLWIYTAVILAALFKTKHKKELLLLNISFLFIVIPFFIPFFRRLLAENMKYSLIVLTRMMGYMPFWGAILTSIAFYCTCSYFPRVQKYKGYLFVMLIGILVWIYYPQNAVRIKEMIYVNSPYNQFVSTLLPTGEELISALEKIKPLDRLFVIGEDITTPKQIQVLTGRSIAPLDFYAAASKTFMVSPDFVPRNKASLKAHEMLVKAAGDDPSWWVELKEKLRQGETNYLIVPIALNKIQGIPMDNVLDKLTDDKHFEVLFLGNYSYIFKVK